MNPPVPLSLFLGVALDVPQGNFVSTDAAAEEPVGWVMTHPTLLTWSVSSKKRIILTLDPPDSAAMRGNRLPRAVVYSSQRLMSLSEKSIMRKSGYRESAD